MQASRLQFKVEFTFELATIGCTSGLSNHQLPSDLQLPSQNNAKDAKDKNYGCYESFLQNRTLVQNIILDLHPQIGHCIMGWIDTFHQRNHGTEAHRL